MSATPPRSAARWTWCCSTALCPPPARCFNCSTPAPRPAAFTTVNLPALGAGLAWDNQIDANGSIAVVAAPGGGPQFGSVTLSGGNLIFSGTGGDDQRELRGAQFHERRRAIDGLDSRFDQPV